MVWVVGSESAQMRDKKEPFSCDSSLEPMGDRCFAILVGVFCVESQETIVS